MTNPPLSLTLLQTSAPAAAGSCGCDSGGCALPAEPAASADAAVRRIRVEGMTCEHCVRAVTDELSALDGVESVAIDLVAGGSSLVTIGTSADLDDAAVRGAIEEAGYRVS